MTFFFLTPSTDSATSKYECENIAAKLSHVADLPVECHNFPEILLNLARRDSKYITSVAPNAFKGMYPGQAAAAMAARKRGELNHIQIQRRMTRRHS